MSEEPSEKEQEHREFASFLLEHSKGRTHDELTNKLAELVVAVQETKKPGKLQLTITIAPAKNVEEMVVVSDTVRLNAPTLDRPATMFFASSDGELTRDHPNQQTMFSIQGEATR